MDWQPDTDPPADGQSQAQLEDRFGEDGPDLEQPASTEPDSHRAESRPKRPSLGATTLDAFFSLLGATLVAARPKPTSTGENGANGDPREARENVKRALKELRDWQTADGDGPKHRILHIVAPTALIAVAVGLMTLFPGAPETLSPQLVGTWETVAEKYADRALVLSQDEIAFGQGPAGGFARYPIKAVNSRRENDGTLVYVITYDNAGVLHRFSFIHQPVTNTVTLKNQPRVAWKKAGE